jgi:hypothetical protein
MAGKQRWSARDERGSMGEECIVRRKLPFCLLAGGQCILHLVYRWPVGDEYMSLQCHPGSQNAYACQFECPVGLSLRQGDPLSHVLFNLVADSFTRMILRQQNDLIYGLIDHLIPKGISILQYVDDTILCLQDDNEKAKNVKLLLYIYEHMSGLKINFKNSEVVLIGGDNNKVVEYVDIFDC